MGWLWEQAYGEVSAALHMDHLCHNRAAVCAPATCEHRQCVNPDHLEPVPPRTNTLRGKTLQAAFAARTHCDYGHEFTADNTAWRQRSGKPLGRVCKECRKLASRKPRTGDPSRSRVRHDEVLHMTELVALGLTRREIAVRVGRSYATVVKYCKGAQVA